MKANKTDKTGFQQAIIGLPKKPPLTSLNQTLKFEAINQDQTCKLCIINSHKLGQF